jgi:FkbM family methyltransferase
VLKFKDPVTGINYKYEESSGIARRRVDSILTKEEGTIKWIRAFDKEDAFCDIGANIGLYTIFAAPLVQCVFAFEPHVGNMHSLLKNINLNKYDNVYAYCLALSNQEYCMPFEYSSFEIGSSNHQLLQGDDGTVRPEYEFKFTKTLDNVLRDTDSRTPNHIKIDVDGIELQVLEGMEETLSSKDVKSVLCEYNPVQSKNKLDEFMIAVGFQLKEKQLTAAGKKAVAKGSNIEDIAHNRLYIKK